VLQAWWGEQRSLKAGTDGKLISACSGCLGVFCAKKSCATSMCNDCFHISCGECDETYGCGSCGDVRCLRCRDRTRCADCKFQVGFLFSNHRHGRSVIVWWQECSHCFDVEFWSRCDVETCESQLCEECGYFCEACERLVCRGCTKICARCGEMHVACAAVHCVCAHRVTPAEESTCQDCVFKTCDCGETVCSEACAGESVCSICRRFFCGKCLLGSEGPFICPHCSITEVRDAQGVCNDLEPPKFSMNGEGAEAVYHAYCHEGVNGGFIAWPRGALERYVIGIRLLVTDRHGSLYFEMDERIKLVTLMELYCSRREIAREM
jgi:hypothetical protein